MSCWENFCVGDLGRDFPWVVADWLTQDQSRTFGGPTSGFDSNCAFDVPP